MKIVQFESTNVKRLSAVQITPSGATVVIGGKNGQGKSSVLDSIMYALAGGDSLPEQPIRLGEDSAEVRLDIGDYIITRKFTRSDSGETKSRLEIRNKEGFKASSPRALLDGLCGQIAFDPLAFSRLKPREQCDAVRKLVGIDFTALDADRAQLYDDRTEFNRDLKSADAELERIGDLPADIPDEFVSVDTLLKELTAAQDANRKRRAIESKINQCEQRESAAVRTYKHLANDIAELESQIAKLRDKQSLAEADRQDAINERLKTVELLESNPEVDTEPIHARIKESESINRRVEAKKRLSDVKANREATAGKIMQIAQAIEAIDREKTRQLAAAKWPVDGLGFATDGLTFNGLPFSQASSAEQLRVSVAMGLALNPKLRVMLIRDGSLLDEESLSMVEGMAAAADAQIWIEKVSVGADVSVIIEDGHVKVGEPVGV